jgi:hypothetical protein
MPKRNDARHIQDIKIFNRMFPYLMPKRTESLVYFTFELEMTHAVQYIHRKNRASAGKKYRIFDVILAALARTFALRPGLNRFIANYEYWQRDEITFNFVVKKDLTEDAPERNAIVRLTPEMTFEQVAELIGITIDDLRGSEESDDESVIKYFLKMPKWFLKFAVGILKHLDKHGRYPKALREVDGLHVSAYVANLGSINISNPPLHHLYEWGTTSVFVTIGKMHRKRLFNEQNVEQVKDTLELGITIDERIAEGFYFMKAIKMLQRFIEHPELLDEPFNPDDIR